MSYVPDDAVTSGRDWDTAFLSQRDLSLTVPVNFVTEPGVALTPACFSDRAYSDQDAQKCFSNLLAAGFRRFVIDLYWDSRRAVWSLCPVEIPLVASPIDNAGTTATHSPSADTAQPTSNPPLSTLSVNQRAVVVKRQASDRSQTSSKVTQIVSSVTSDSSTTPSNTTAMAAPTALPVADGGLLELGPFRCTPTVQFATLLTVISDYVAQSGNTLQFELLYLTLEIHAAASSNSPTEPALQPAGSSLPAPGNLLSDVINTNLSSLIYTPSELADERTKLNSTWLSVENAERDLRYYDIEIQGDDSAVTAAGWPSELYIGYESAARVLAFFGRVDPQMGNYDLNADEEFIFRSDVVFERNVSMSTSGTIESGCYLSPSTPSLVPETNSSWATAALSQDFVPPPGEPLDTALAAFNNITSCGISPVLNSTLSGEPAFRNPAAYTAFGRASIWSWATEQPLNTTIPGGEKAPSTSIQELSNLRCAALYPSLAGHWQSTDCNRQLKAACRVKNGPYEWLVSDRRAAYSASADSCPSDSIFGVPRTALENSYLATAIRASTGPTSSGNGEIEADEPVWVNFNSLSLSNCWVVGINQTCPYVSTGEDADQTRTVVVPAVVAVVGFTLAVFLVFVKCGANRQEVRRGRRRRGDDGWDYEGVPS